MLEVATLSWANAVWVTVIVCLAVLIAGAAVIVGRNRMGSQDPGASLVRSWIAVSLVLGLLVFTAVALTLDDTTLRSTLVGALAANVGTAVAFYFATKSSDQARKDILDATFGYEEVPDLVGKTDTEAKSLLSTVALRYEVAADSPAGGTQIETQTPPKNSRVRAGTSVIVRMKT